MAGNISLESSIRTCKIDTAYANKVQSDRFLNPGNMVCPVWNGFDSAGRPACADSFRTKTAGCNSAEDRVMVENYQRPQYVEYINLSAGGIGGEIYGASPPYTVSQWDTMQAAANVNSVNNLTGSFGTQFGAYVYPNCGVHRYTRAMTQNIPPPINPPPNAMIPTSEFIATPRIPLDRNGDLIEMYPNQSCGVNQYTRAMAQNAEALRKYSSFNQAYSSNVMKNYGGN